MIKTKGGLQIEKVAIKYGFVSINRENDSELFSTKMKTIFNRKEKQIFSTNFGENDFLIVYDNKYYYSFRHFIPSDFVNDDPTGHNYNFLLYKRDGKIFCDIEIKGEMPMKFTHVMSDVKTAKNRRCNTPKEKAGVMFNMIEMEEK
ncbi:hypothetical protein QJU43_04625 [Pasteurella atlantica]|uniref:hypothetical protein n=1 Tax=Pasteurellaceae TaxID=712 RepID=UPI00274D792A|nr:hypothetical protein [Pasteurella atlantica]MDP8033590.1 hypothetical protein [Pasteurella atlantica]MDP8035630.1 hypothetical protein [Pasteurella atlantica]MDP8037581.1 hypothetical protein [Pasteurella atlantica]MDP8047930.1 hypothetical protein [Pasteurella atlantica]MDP8049885.1 hypothetical protein [Pasteurella atlantica]